MWRTPPDGGCAVRPPFCGVHYVVCHQTKLGWDSMACRFCDTYRRFTNSGSPVIGPLMSYDRPDFSYMPGNQMSQDLRAIESRPRFPEQNLKRGCEHWMCRMFIVYIYTYILGTLRYLGMSRCCESRCPLFVLYWFPCVQTVHTVDISVCSDCSYCKDLRMFRLFKLFPCLDCSS